MQNQSDNKRLAKNTLLLYFRMFIMMGISLFTSRVILQTLGVSDYGIYNVVAGAIMMIGFVMASFATASSRFITIAIGKGETEEMKKTFGGILAIQCLLALFIVFLAETIGLWFLNTQLVIPEDRMNAATFVYQFSVVSCAINIIIIPYNAAIVAHEKMSAFAYIAIFDSVLKLVVVYTLYIVPLDKLIVYAFLLLIVGFIDFLIHYCYSIYSFMETRGKPLLDKKLSRDVLKYTSWTLTGAVTSMTCNQGINFLLNIFFGPVVNAARGVAFSVQMIIQNFATNFQTALNPQIVKSFANSNYERINELVRIGTKFSFYLLLLISMPVFLKIDFLLSIWLVEVPKYTNTFISLLLVINLIHSALANPLIFAINATGDIKAFQIAEGICLISIIPISYFLFKFYDLSPIAIFYVYIIVESITQIVRMIIVIPKAKLDVTSYFKDTLLPICLVLLIVVPSSILVNLINTDTWLNLFLVSLIEIIIVGGAVFLVGLSPEERFILLSKLKVKR
jgi:O-antigen/teichoic acid export membrane protein